MHLHASVIANQCNRWRCNSPLSQVKGISVLWIFNMPVKGNRQGVQHRVFESMSMSDLPVYMPAFRRIVGWLSYWHACARQAEEATDRSEGGVLLTAASKERPTLGTVRNTAPVCFTRHMLVSCCAVDCGVLKRIAKQCCQPSSANMLKAAGSATWSTPQAPAVVACAIRCSAPAAVCLSLDTRASP